MFFLKSLSHKILFVFAFCTSITFLGFFAVYYLTLEQHRSLKQQAEIPSFSINWFRLNNGILKSTWAQQSFLNSNDKKFIEERNLIWDTEINPSFDYLGTLYKKHRIWIGEREVERRAFYDLRLMILNLKNVQQKTLKLSPTEADEKSLKNWTLYEWPLVLKIIKQIELLVRWQTDYSNQKASELEKEFSLLGIWIWLIASIVLILVLIIALFFAKRISAPLKNLRNEVNKIFLDQNIKLMNSKFNLQGINEDYLKNEDEIKKLTESFRKMESAIRERTELLEASNRQLDESNRAKGIYLTNMSHELRTPLNAIIGFTEVLLKTGKGESLSDYKKDRLNRILKSGKHLLELINSLLDLSKIEAGRMEIEKKKFKIITLLQEVMESLEPLLIEKSMKHNIIFNTENQLMIYTDAGKVRQILINLIGNAIKFTESGGLIEIKISQNENEIIVSIKDNGCGIRKENQENIFKIFHQVKSSRNIENKKGTGLGLAMVQSLIKLLGGSITLESMVGKGSNFTIRLPLDQ